MLWEQEVPAHQRVQDPLLLTDNSMSVGWGWPLRWSYDPFPSELKFSSPPLKLVREQEERTLVKRPFLARDRLFLSLVGPGGVYIFLSLCVKAPKPSQTQQSNATGMRPFFCATIRGWFGPVEPSALKLTGTALRSITTEWVSKAQNGFPEHQLARLPSFPQYEQLP